MSKTLQGHRTITKIGFRRLFHLVTAVTMGRRSRAGDGRDGSAKNVWSGGYINIDAPSRKEVSVCYVHLCIML